MAFSRTMAPFVAAVMIVVAACAPAAAPPPAPATPVAAPNRETGGAPKEAAAAKPSSKDAEAMAKYEALVQAAKKEAKISISNSQAFVREALKESFGKKFGIDVDFLHLTAGDLFTRLRTERQAEQYNLDIVLSGGTALIVTMMPEGMLDRLDDVLILPEVTDSSKWLEGKIPWLDPERRTLRLNKYVSPYVSINTSKVSTGDIRVYKDLLNPKWKGKIAAHDPTVAGSGAVAGSFMLLTLGEDFVKQLYLGQEVVLSREYRQMADWLGRGSYPILIGGTDQAISQLRKDGLPVEHVIPEDTGAVDMGWGGMGMVSKAPHPNAARLFVNWLASKEGQEMWLKVTLWPVTRVDVDQSAAPDFMKLKPGIRYVDMLDHGFVTSERAKAENRLRELIQR